MTGRPRVGLTGTVLAVACVAALAGALAVHASAGDRAAAAAGRAGAALAAGHSAAALAEARTAVARAPLRTAFVRQLARTHALAGDVKAAAALFGQAGALGWRDTPTQLVLLASALANRDVEAAADRADALARRKRHRAESYAALRMVAQMPKGTAAVAERLARQPPYRLEYFQNTEPMTAADLDARERLYATLASTIAAPDEDEVLPYVVALRKRGQDARALAVWVRFTQRGARSDQAINDPGFAQIHPEDDGYGWVADGSSQATLALDPGEGAAPDRLRVQSDGRASGIVLRQRLALTPGKHRFRIWRRDGDARAADVLRWQLRCGEGESPDLIASARASATETKALVQIDFTVPTDCPGQRLELVTRAVDRTGTITAWFVQPGIR